MKNALATVLRICDEGGTVARMCAESGLKYGRVYAILRRYRPNRPRQVRPRTSDVPDKVRGLHKVNIPPVRIAFLLKITPAYVYSILSRQEFR